MADLARTKKTGVDGIEAKQATMGDLVQWIDAAGAESGGISSVANAVIADRLGMSLKEMDLMTDAGMEKLLQLSLEDYQKIIPVCKELNADFFEFRANLRSPAKESQTVEG